MSLILVTVGFLLGSIPFGLLLHGALAGRDLRRSGSGNIGATNVARSLGLGAGLAVLVLDAGKGALPPWLARVAGAEVLVALLAGVAAVAGHVFSPWLRGRGGKGVATSLGVLVAISPPIALETALVFLAVVAWTGFVSLASMTASLGAPVLLLASGRAFEEVMVTALLAVIVVWRHRDNIGRLRAGVEPRFRRPAGRCPAAGTDSRRASGSVPKALRASGRC